VTVVTYVRGYKRSPKKKPQAAAIEGSAIVTAKKPGPRQRAEAEPDSEAQAAMRAWLRRAMLGHLPGGG
jgi:hypothetical protein